MTSIIKQLKLKTLRLSIQLFDNLRNLSQQNIYNGYREKYNIASSFSFNGPNILFYSDGEIHCGLDSYIGIGSTIQAVSGCKVVIGKKCMISHNVRMYTHSYIADHDFSKEPCPIKTGNIIIGDYVWIGANVLINPGITIGENAVIGANSVITKDVEANAIVGGVPAKLIRHKQSLSVL